MSMHVIYVGFQKTVDKVPQKPLFRVEANGIEVQLLAHLEEMHKLGQALKSGESLMPCRGCEMKDGSEGIDGALCTSAG